MLGTVDGDVRRPWRRFGVSAHANRVPVEHGHTVCLSVEFERTADAAEAVEALARVAAAPSPARGLPERARARHRRARDDARSPAAAARRRRAARGMTVTVGRVRPDPLLDVQARGDGTQHRARRGRRVGAQRRAPRGRGLVGHRGASRDRLQVRRHLGRRRRGDRARWPASSRTRRDRGALVVVSALAGATNALLADRRAGGAGPAHRRAARASKGCASGTSRRPRRSLGTGRRRPTTSAPSCARCSTSWRSLAEALSRARRPHAAQRSTRSPSFGEQLSSVLVVGGASSGTGCPPSTSTRARSMITDDSFTRAEPQPDAIAESARSVAAADRARRDGFR